jgi:hypothetical protein
MNLEIKIATDKNNEIRLAAWLQWKRTRARPRVQPSVPPKKLK